MCVCVRKLFRPNDAVLMNILLSNEVLDVERPTVVVARNEDHDFERGARLVMPSNMVILLTDS